MSGPACDAEIEQFALRFAGRAPGLTIADVMTKFRLGMRPSSRVLFDLEARGRLTRSGGEPGNPLLWHRVRN